MLHWQDQRPRPVPERLQQLPWSRQRRQSPNTSSCGASTTLETYRMMRVVAWLRGLAIAITCNAPVQKFRNLRKQVGGDYLGRS